MWLRLQSGDRDGVRQAFERGRSSLDDGLDQAAALWMCALTDSTGSASWTEDLQEEHPFSPFWRSLAPPNGPPVDDAETLARRLIAAQRSAFATVSAHLEMGEDPPRVLAEIARMAELGLMVRSGDAPLGLGRGPTQRHEGDRRGGSFGVADGNPGSAGALRVDPRTTSA